MEGFRHTVGLGMGVLPEARGRGLGARLLRKAIEGRRVRGRKLDGKYDDVILMGKLL